MIVHRSVSPYPLLISATAQKVLGVFILLEQHRQNANAAPKYIVNGDGAADIGEAGFGGCSLLKLLQIAGTEFLAIVTARRIV